MKVANSQRAEAWAASEEAIEADQSNGKNQKFCRMKKTIALFDKIYGFDTCRTS